LYKKLSENVSLFCEIENENIRNNPTISNVFDSFVYTSVTSNEIIKE